MNRRTAILTGISALFGKTLLADDGFLSRAREAAEEILSKPVVTLYTDPPNCLPCRQLEASIEEYGEFNLPFRIVRKQPAGQSIPRFVWGKWYHAGYEPIEKFIRRWEYANSLDGEEPQAPTTTSYTYYPVERQDWNFTGVFNASRQRMVNHLAGPNHRFERSWLERLENNELWSLHDAHHEGRVQWQYVPNQFRRALCPT